MIIDLWKDLFRRTLASKIEASVALGKIEAAIIYLNFIKGARRMTMLACILVLCVVILACGFLLIPVGLCLFMPWAPQTKAIVAVSVGAAYIVIPLIAGIVLFSEKRWMKMSSADKLLKSALRKRT
jgi:hypothetical protein